MAVSTNSSTTGVGGFATPVLPLSVPSTGYNYAVRASQASFGTLIDQSAAANVFTVNTALFPPAFTATTLVALNAYRTPTTANGLIYKCTTSGTTGASETAWGTTIGGTTTQGTAIFTAEKGPWFVDAGGTRLFRSISSTQTGAVGTFQPSNSLTWSLNQGRSLIVHLRVKMDWNASGQGVLPIFSSCQAATGPGIRLLATGGSLQDLRVQVRTASGNILTDDTSAAFARKPFDGLERSIVIMVDDVLKMMYCYIDGLPIVQGDMFNTSTGICPNNLNLASLTGTTSSGTFTIGGDPGGAISTECAFKAVDVITFAGGLPANIQNVVSWFNRGGEIPLPQTLVSL